MDKEAKMQNRYWLSRNTSFFAKVPNIDPEPTARHSTFDLKHYNFLPEIMESN
jgi:hypothetical protein